MQNVTSILQHRVRSGHLTDDPGLLQEQFSKLYPTLTPSSATTNKLSVCKATTRAECLGLFLLEGYNRHPFGGRIEELEDDFFKGQDDHPDNFTGSYNLLINYQNMRFAQTDVGNELAFLSNGKKELKIFNMPQMQVKRELYKQVS